MKKNKWIFEITVFAMCIVFFSSCIKEHVTGVILNKNELILLPRETETLIAKVLPENASNQNVIWRSSNPTVVTVDRKGNVTKNIVGDAIITVTTKDGKYTDTCLVTGDYRNKWIGTYDCEEGERIHVKVNVGIVGDSSLYLVEQGLLQYQYGINHTVKINPDGKFNLLSYRFENLTGYFYSDSIIIKYINISPGGAGGIYQYKGKKC